MQTWHTAPLGPRQRRQGLSPTQWTGGTRIAISGCAFWAVSRWGLLGCGPSSQDLSPNPPSGAAGSMRGSYLEPGQGLAIPLDSQGVSLLFIFPSPTLMSAPLLPAESRSLWASCPPQGKRFVSAHLSSSTPSPST